MTPGPPYVAGGDATVVYDVDRAVDVGPGRVVEDDATRQAVMRRETIEGVGQDRDGGQQSFTRAE